jgi:lysophospholipase L1-like esterase
MTTVRPKLAAVMAVRPCSTLDAARRWIAPWVFVVVLGCGSRCSNAASVAPGAPAGAALESPSSRETGEVGPGLVPSATGGGPALAAPVAGGPGVVHGGVRWLGRVDARDPGAVKFAWSATGFVATVTGTKISVKLQTEDAERAFFQPVIDGKAGPRIEVPSGEAQTVTLGEGLSPGDHTVELYRESEGMYGASVFTGFVDGAVKGAPAPSGRLIEIVGDSISAGYGNLGKEVHPPWDNACGFSLDTESAYQAYSSMLGRTLGAEVSVIARSGWGMYRDGNGDKNGVLRTVYANILGTQAGLATDFKRQPDAVVINLGTNDSTKGDPGKPYEDAYVDFLHVVRRHYAGAWIFLTLGPMTSDPPLSQMRAHLKNVASALADAKVVVVEMPSQDATSTGCDYHPNVAEDAKMADVLATAIRGKLRW